MAKHSKASSKNNKKVIAIASLAVILVVALGIIAYQVFYPHKTSDKSASFAQTSSTKVSKSKSTNSSSAASNSTQASTSASSSSNTSTSSTSQSNASPTSWSALTDKQQDAVYAQWINNAQGKFDVYTGEAYLTYLVNVGTNGVSTYSDPVNVIQNTARIQQNADGTYYLQVPEPNQTGLRMAENPWSLVNWQTKETLTSAQLFAKYGTSSGLDTGNAQIKSINATTVPTGNA
ncbi:hypothetical protein [Lactococcus lactis]|uniref:Uncharacterized protein n=1 Tax=Lactococcus lactis subsp. lactis TaxID=1360 RepID=A0A2N5WFS3_LACLL|nr:hypothetical protein [Lactococcus lactis]MBU5242178.1 hypothetical protein [Lactococcus lactis]MDT2856487.1 hypothetical protein [Lactococcus lactis]PLW61067.1 hypothetical protein CYU10_002134 [Lactococcus lactis subsp. lactis]